MVRLRVSTCPLHMVLSRTIFRMNSGIAILPPVCSTSASNAASRLSPACDETRARSYAARDMLTAFGLLKSSAFFAKKASEESSANLPTLQTFCLFG